MNTHSWVSDEYLRNSHIAGTVIGFLVGAVLTTMLVVILSLSSEDVSEQRLVLLETYGFVEDTGIELLHSEEISMQACRYFQNNFDGEDIVTRCMEID